MSEYITVSTPRGKMVTMAYREGTTDLSTIGATFELWGQLHDEYGLAALHPETFLDIGGHIGTITVAVLVDNPDCRAVIIEPFSENIAAINENLVLTDTLDRATVIQGAIGTNPTQRIGYTLPRVPGAEEVHRYVGSPMGDDYQGEAVDVETFSLSDLMDMLGKTVDLAKIDCEGCEWVALKDKAAKRATRWVGEYHGNPGPDEVVKALGKTYTVETAAHDHGATGMFTAVKR